MDADGDASACGDARPAHTLSLRVRQWPSHPLDGTWLAALRRAGLQAVNLPQLRSAITRDRTTHVFETQTWAALQHHWNAVYRALWKLTRQRWGVFARAMRVRAAPAAGGEDGWLRGTMADLQQPVADADRNYYYLRTVRCEWTVHDGVLVAPYALAREDVHAKAHVLLSLCVIEARLTGTGDVAALGGQLEAPRVLSIEVPPRARPHTEKPVAAAAVVVTSADDEARDSGIERIPRIGRIVEVVATDAAPPAPVDPGSLSPVSAYDGVDVYGVATARAQWDEWTDDLPPLWE